MRGYSCDQAELKGVKRKVCFVLDLQLIQLTYYGVEIRVFLGGGGSLVDYFVGGFNCACFAWLFENLSSCVLPLNCYP